MMIASDGGDDIVVVILTGTEAQHIYDQLASSFIKQNSILERLKNSLQGEVIT